MRDQAVGTVDRVAALLRTLAGAASPGMPLAELATATGLAKPTAHRLLGALVHTGFIVQETGSRRYRLGSGAATLGQVAHRHDLAAVAEPALARLAAETGDTAFASVVEGPAAVCVARAVGTYPIRTLTLEVGSRRPLGVGAGSLALLAALPEREAERAMALNAGWLADYPGFTAAELRTLVARTRAEGHALNEGRIVAAMTAVAVAVRDTFGAPRLALSLAAIRDRMGPDRLPELVRLLQGEAVALETIARDAGAEPDVQG